MNSIIIGVGRRGGDIVDRLSKDLGAPALFADTDWDDLELHREDARVRLGSHISDEEFVRNDPSFSYKATMADRAAIEDRLRGFGALVLVAGLGGGTGAGGSRALATIAHDLGMVVIALVTRPFQLEGEVRIARGRRGFLELVKLVDLVVAFHQDLLVPLVGKRSRVRDLVVVADEVIGNAAKSMVAFLDANEAREIDGLLRSGGTGLFSYGISETPDGVAEATAFALGGPFFEGVSLAQTRGISLSVLSRQPVATVELDRALERLRQGTSEEARFFVTQLVEPSQDHELEVHIHLTGDFGDPQTHMGEFWVPGPTG